MNFDVTRDLKRWYYEKVWKAEAGRFFKNFITNRVRFMPDDEFDYLVGLDNDFDTAFRHVLDYGFGEMRLTSKLSPREART